MEPERIKHLEFIQNIISRMNANSFQIKGWMITIVSALLALYASSKNYVYVFVAIVPTILFWLLDSYYLQQERKFRGLYSDIINQKNDLVAFVMSVDGYKDGRYKYCQCFWSKTIVLLYLPMSLLLLIGGFVLTYWDCIRQVLSNNN